MGIIKSMHRLLPRSDRTEIAAGIGLGFLVGVAILAIVTLCAPGPVRPRSSFPGGTLTASSIRQHGNHAHFADLRGESASRDVRYMANWVADSNDAAGLAFVIVDKLNAKAYVFNSDALLLGSSAVLLGAASGDDSMPGIGSRPIAEVLPGERTTPAGRFVAERGHNSRGEDVVWVDYDAAVSMHRVLTTNPAERRLERLASPSSDDNRISYGCINVPVAFYEAYIRPTFATHRAIVYILPEVKSLEEVFGAYDAAAVHGLVRSETGVGLGS
jgi:hypothetical protein